MFPSDIRCFWNHVVLRTITRYPFLGINLTVFPPEVLGLVRETMGKMGQCL